MKRKRGPATKPLPRLKRRKRPPARLADDTPAAGSGVRRSQAPPFLVAAVGASAGGLEAVTGLLRGLPSDAELAVLIVQHLSRTAKSHLAELLSHSVAMQVVEASDRLLIQPRHVYVIPADTRMTVTDGRLSVLPTGDAGRPAVDVLFQSVADQYAERGVAVVLSGGGSDGTVGLTAVKSAGGFTFAQAPKEAKVTGMPQSAIDTGSVDAVLGVEEIAQELLRLSKHPLFRGEAAAHGPPEQSGDEPQLRRIFQVLRKTSGIDFGLYKPPTISRRIRRRMALHRVNTLEDYARFVQEHATEAAFLQEDLLIHVTSFFREPESFEALRTEVFPRLQADRIGRDPIRVWIPGCSSGEEVYSFAISLMEFLGDDREVPIQIFGTDVSERMVDRARAGIYSAAAVADVGADRLRRFFTRADGGYRVSKALREKCIFARQDITQDPPFSKLDLVVCRNLLIYLSEAAQRRTIAVFNYAIKAGGYLVLGRSETIGPQVDLFSAVDKRFKIYAKKPDVAQSRRSRPIVDPGFERLPSPDAPATWSEPEAPGADLQSEVNRFLINRYAPPGVVVDRQLRIQRSRGRTGPYLELPAGEVSLDILRMARQELIAGLRGALNEARIRGATARKENLRFLYDGHPRTVNIEVTPVGEAATQQFLVVFEEPSRSPAARGPEPRAAVNKKGKRSAASTRKLEEELAETREHLEAMIRELGAANEELQSSNEEILSSNEELQSTNEELDTAKEELQSANEELNTLNDELEGRNRELTALNGDLHNLLTVVNIPIVIVTSQLLVRRFTPAAERVWNLIPTDTGRPISQVRPNIDCPDLEKLIREVVETVTPREREVDGDEGRRYTLRVRPYKTLDNKIDGAMLTLFDVTDEVDLARHTAETIMSSVHEPIALLDGDQKIQLVNPGFSQMFGTPASDLRGKPWQELIKLGWDRLALGKLIEEVLPTSKKVDHYPVEYRVDGVEPRLLLLDGSRLQGGATGSTIVLLTVRQAPNGHPAS